MNRQHSLLLSTALLFSIFTRGQSTHDSTRLSDSTHPTQIQAVIVVKKKPPPIEFRADKMVINVESSVTNTGATAMEILKKSPGILVDKDGNISLKGKQDVVIMLDDKLTYLSGTELADLLNSLSASQLEQIEIMTNPSAKYDAAGNAGIINIRTKKNRTRGFNGTSTAGYGQGVYPRYNGGVNLNYRDLKYNLFLLYNHNTEEGFEELGVLRRYFDTDGKTILEHVSSDNMLKRRNHTNTIRLGMDYYPGAHTTLGIAVTGFKTTHTVNGSSLVDVEDGDRNIDSSSRDASMERKTIHNGALNLNFQHRIDSARQLTGSIDYIQYHFTDTQHFYNNTYLPDGSVSSLNQLLGDLPNRISIYSGKLDYTHTISTMLRLETGWKSSAVRTDNIADYFNLDSTGWSPDYGKTNHFIYRENINAAYISLYLTRKKWNFQGGLRFENTLSRGHQLGNPGKADSSFNRQYNDLFPTLLISFDQDKDNKWTISAGRRIDRPAYQDLNPFLFYVNQYTYRVGNPFILPQYTNNIEAGWIYKGILSTTINYSHTSNFFNGILRAQHDTTIIMSGNIRKYESAGIEMNASLSLTPWWTAVLEANLNYIDENAYITGSQIKSAAASGQMNVNNQLSLAKGWSGEVSAFYNTSSVEGQNSSEPFGQVSAGLSKRIHQWVARLSVTDIFLNNNYRGGVAYQDVRVRYTDKQDSRVINLGLTYRFGSSIRQTTKTYQGNVQEETRVKN